VKHEEFAERAGRRLERMAARLQSEAKRPAIDGELSKTTTARTQELKAAALLVREEAVVVGREERETPEEMVAENLSFEAQG
jgi:hypothetical protein